MNKFMGKEIGAQMQTNLLCFSLYFSIFFFFFKQPKSIHISKNCPQRYAFHFKQASFFVKFLIMSRVFKTHFTIQASILPHTNYIYRHFNFEVTSKALAKLTKVGTS